MKLLYETVEAFRYMVSRLLIQGRQGYLRVPKPPKLSG